METFLEYITRDHCDCLTGIIAKERVKQGAKNKLLRESPKKSVKEQASEEINDMMPPRDLWRRLSKKTRGKLANLSKGANKVEANTLAIKKTISAHRKSTETYGYLKKLDKYTKDIADIVSGDGSNAFSKKDFTILPKFKEDEGPNAIYRPLCIYNNLKTKVLISAASAYLTQYFDSHLHEEILSYRPRRMYHGKMKNTDGNDAIKSIKKYLEDHPGQNIYVAECDIQKFFDIINPDIVLDCFDRLAEKAGLPDYHQVRNILKAYLDSYGFVPDVYDLNNNDNYWGYTRKRHRGIVKGKCMYKWVKEEEFYAAYTKEEFEECRTKLGVPQGGALSCVISNVVLNDVDQAIVAEEDSDRFFARYGDDMILMHTDEAKCKELLERYKAALLEHKLIFHKFADFESVKKGEKTTKKFWQCKSKPVFLWGPGEGEAAEWIGFVGYEICRNGAVRLRISTLNKKFKDINKTYHKCLESKISSANRHIEKVKKNIKGLPSALEKFEALVYPVKSNSEDKKGNDLIYQMKGLDRFRHKKIGRLDSKLSEKYKNEAGLVKHFKAHPDCSYFRTILNKQKPILP